MKNHLFLVLIFLTVFSCKKDANKGSISSSGKTNLAEISSVDLQNIKSVVEYGKSIIPYIVKSKNRGALISFNVDQIVNDYSNLEKLWDAYKLVENSETFDALTDLSIGITQAIDVYVAANVKKITDKMVLDYVILWYEKRLSKGQNIETLTKKILELKNRKKGCSPNCRSSYLKLIKYLHLTMN